jgi:hypothetical protein
MILKDITVWKSVLARVLQNERITAMTYETNGM